MDENTKNKLKEEGNVYFWTKTLPNETSKIEHYNTLGNLIFSLNLSDNAVIITSPRASVVFVFISEYEGFKLSVVNGIYCAGRYRKNYVYCDPYCSHYDINILDGEKTYHIIFEE